MSHKAVNVPLEDYEKLREISAQSGSPVSRIIGYLISLHEGEKPVTNKEIGQLYPSKRMKFPEMKKSFLNFRKKNPDSSPEEVMEALGFSKAQYDAISGEGFLRAIKVLKKRKGVSAERLSVLADITLSLAERAIAVKSGEKRPTRIESSLLK